MDDVDAVQAQIARNMLQSGDWVTARLDGVAYLEKSPLVYWMMAVSCRIFGVHDWAARLPIALSVVLLCWVVYRFGRWGFGEEAGVCAGLALATCTGLFLFTRIQIPDVILTLAITGTIWGWLRLLEPDPPESGAWSLLPGVCLGLGLLLKGLIAVVFPVGAVFVYLAVTRQLFSRAALARLRLGTVVVTALVIATPWEILATIRNPPYFVVSMHSGPGQYRGFFWFYFFNEHLLRFLNLRYPRDYNTVPRLWFWLFNLIWLFPWSVYLPAAGGLSFRPTTREGRVRLMALCWIGVVMVFFTFSTTQEYYSMPIYPALALLIGSGLAGWERGCSAGRWVLLSIFAALTAVLGGLLVYVWRLPAQGEIAEALRQNPELYTLSLGHLTDLTLPAFAYLKLPLAIATAAFAIGAVGLVVARKSVWRTILVTAAAMIVFLQAARIALVRFDSYLGSYPLAVALESSPSGTLIEANAYYAFSSVFFYTDRTALLWNGRINNLEYGSNAPDAPHVFIEDRDLQTLWSSRQRCYLLAYGSEMSHLEALVGKPAIFVVKESSGNYLLTNQPLR